jgi:hypothetical protein
MSSQQKPNTARDIRGEELAVGDWVVAERSYTGMVAGRIVEIRKHIKVFVQNQVNPQSAGEYWYDPNHIIKVLGFPFNPQRGLNSHDWTGQPLNDKASTDI